jgi:hypothetical protein
MNMFIYDNIIIKSFILINQEDFRLSGSLYLHQPKMCNKSQEVYPHGLGCQLDEGRRRLWDININIYFFGDFMCYYCFSYCFGY